MPIHTAYSNQNLPDAVTDLRHQCGAINPRAVICFAASKYDPTELSFQMQASFPGALVIGCTTAGEIAGGKMMTDSVVAMFLDQDIVDDCVLSVVENLSSGVDVNSAFSKFEQHFGAPGCTLDIQKYVGIVLVDGLSGAEEQLMDKLGDRPDLFFIGGSAGDDLKFARTHVWAGGVAYSDAAVLLLLRVKQGFDIIKAQSFKSTGKVLIATKVDEAHRKVIQFNGKPALTAYADALGVAIDEAPALFMRHPLGLMVDGEPYVRSPQRVDGRDMYFYCQIREGMELAILAATDIVGDTRKAIEDHQAAVGPIAGLIDFNCILRTLELRAGRLCDQYGALFAGIPTVGFST